MPGAPETYREPGLPDFRCLERKSCMVSICSSRQTNVAGVPEFKLCRTARYAVTVDVEKIYKIIKGNSITGVMYLRITCGLTQPQGILGGGRGVLQRAKLWELQVVWMSYILVGLPFLVGGNSHLYLLYHNKRENYDNWAMMDRYINCKIQ